MAVPNENLIALLRGSTKGGARKSTKKKSRKGAALIGGKYCAQQVEKPCKRCFSFRAADKPKRYSKTGTEIKFKPPLYYEDELYEPDGSLSYLGKRLKKLNKLTDDENRDFFSFIDRYNLTDSIQDLSDKDFKDAYHYATKPGKIKIVEGSALASDYGSGWENAGLGMGMRRRRGGCCNCTGGRTTRKKRTMKGGASERTPAQKRATKLLKQRTAAFVAAKEMHPSLTRAEFFNKVTHSGGTIGGARRRKLRGGTLQTSENMEEDDSMSDDSDLESEMENLSLED